MRAIHLLKNIVTKLITKPSTTDKVSNPVIELIPRQKPPSITFIDHKGVQVVLDAGLIQWPEHWRN